MSSLYRRAVRASQRSPMVDKPFVGGDSGGDGGGGSNGDGGSNPRRGVGPVCRLRRGGGGGGGFDGGSSNGNSFDGLKVYFEIIDSSRLYERHGIYRYEKKEEEGKEGRVYSYSNVRIFLDRVINRESPEGLDYQGRSLQA
ncbi:hypothetical protein HZH66_001368 [Vespula vulgaris]|uniref:Uncharacterized protein n=1 Tax=Vespula vulgaris TaxID=7454 RepID=A0A834NK81_VESVU|nr:hypothetical protein HZH66_001368 [Vespula vulgaris]